ncbi:hypothetical protein BC567DRAFT_234837 [Phyllosticta citribraziliensis]
MKEHTTMAGGFLCSEDGDAEAEAKRSGIRHRRCSNGCISSGSVCLSVALLGRVRSVGWWLDDLLGSFPSALFSSAFSLTLSLLLFVSVAVLLDRGLYPTTPLIRRHHPRE